MNKGVRISDVARIAAVSTAPVADVMNRPERVAGATRPRVSAAIDRLAYAPASADSQVRSGRTGTVGIIVPDLSNAFWAAVVGSVEAAASAQSIRLVVTTTQGIHRARERRAIESQVKLGVDALLLATFLPPRVVAGYAQLGVPLVLVGRDGTKLGLCSAGVDDVEGMSLAVDHLVEFGHRRIVFVNGSTKSSWCADRRRGWRAAMVRHELDMRQSCVEITIPDVLSGQGPEAVGQLLALRPTPTAVLCANDYIAADVIRSLHAVGQRVPDDVSVVGYDDSSVASIVTPSLSTVRQGADELGRAALSLVDQAQRSAVSHVRLRPSLVERDSSRAVTAKRTSTARREGQLSPAGPTPLATSSRPAGRPTNSATPAAAPYIDLALALIDERGPESLTFRALAQYAKVSLGTVSYHLRDAGDLGDLARSPRSCR